MGDKKCAAYQRRTVCQLYGRPYRQDRVSAVYFSLQVFFYLFALYQLGGSKPPAAGYAVVRQFPGPESRTKETPGFIDNGHIFENGPGQTNIYVYLGLIQVGREYIFPDRSPGR